MGIRVDWRKAATALAEDIIADRQHSDLIQEHFVEDAVQSARSFHAQIQEFGWTDRARVPCAFLQDGPVPVDWKEVLHSGLPEYDALEIEMPPAIRYRDWLDETVVELKESIQRFLPLNPLPQPLFGRNERRKARSRLGGLGLSHGLRPLGEIKEAFRKRLEGFLVSRLSAKDPQHVGFGGSDTVGFEVETQNQGLTVLYSPAYFINPNLVFGAPSSPVANRIYPGRYIFGAVGVGVRARFEPTEYDVPPNRKAQLLEI